MINVILWILFCLSGADTSQHNSPRFIQRTSSPYQHIYSNHDTSTLNKTQPAPPPYPPHLSTVMPLRTRSPLVQPRLLHSTAPPTTAPPPAPIGAPASSTPPSSNKRRRRNVSNSEVQKSVNGTGGISAPPFYALVKAGGPDCSNNVSGSELYARPPSDHFYFKITDGKTEFI